MIDRFFVGLLERFSHRVQRLTGYTCYHLAAACAIVFAVAIVVEHALCHHHDDFEDLLIDSLYLVYSSAYAFWLYERDIDKAASRANGGVANEWKRTLCGTRTFMISVTLLVDVGTIILAITVGSGAMRDGAGWVYPVNLTAMVCWFYFRSCDPLPPCQGKVREWLKMMQERMVPIRAR